MASVQLSQATKVFPGRPAVRAVDRVNLEVRDGELMVFLGPSGCGKTTLLRLIAGLEDPTEGTIEIGGTVMNHVHPKDRDVAMVFQNYALFPHLTVFDNIAFGLKFRKVPRATIKERVLEAARALDLEELLKRRPAALSGGQRQRVALGRAMVRQPQVFLLDEPMSNLDARLRARTRAELARLHARLRTTMIHVTHDQSEAMTLGQRVCVLNNGQVQQIGPPIDVYDRPANMFVASFVGSPAMNLVEGELSVETGHPVFRFPGADGAFNHVVLMGEQFEGLDSWAGRKVAFGVRPEHLRPGKPQAEGALGPAWEGGVELCEPLGHETLVHLRLSADVLVIARAGASFRAVRGEKVAVRALIDKAHLFDATTGAAWARPASAE